MKIILKNEHYFGTTLNSEGVLGANYWISSNSIKKIFVPWKSVSVILIISKILIDWKTFDYLFD